MKTYLTLIALLFSATVVAAQQNSKAADTTKQQKRDVVGSVMPGVGVISSAVNKSTINANNSTSMNASKTKQSQGQTFGEKVSAGMQSAGNAVANGTKTNENPLYQGASTSGVNVLTEKATSPVGPIKGVIVKGSKN
jgi:hypothetical protein